MSIAISPRIEPLPHTMEKSINRYVFNNFHTFYSLYKLEIIPLPELLIELKNSLLSLYTTISGHDYSYDAYQNSLDSLMMFQGKNFPLPELFLQAYSSIPNIMKPISEASFNRVHYHMNETISYRNNHILEYSFTNHADMEEQRIYHLGYCVYSNLNPETYLQIMRHKLMTLLSKMESLGDTTLESHYTDNKNTNNKNISHSQFAWEYRDRVIEPTKDLIQKIITKWM